MMRAATCQIAQGVTENHPLDPMRAVRTFARLNAQDIRRSAQDCAQRIQYTSIATLPCLRKPAGVCNRRFHKCCRHDLPGFGVLCFEYGCKSSASLYQYEIAAMNKAYVVFTQMKSQR